MLAISCMADPVEWFAVQVWTGREHISAEHLRIRGYDVFLPCHAERRRWSDRIKVVHRALFTGYVFCRIRMETREKVVTAPGVLRIVGDGRGPLPVSTDEISAIRRIVDSGVAAEPCPFPQVGQEIQIQSGPFKGLVGTIQIVRNRHRLVVSVSLLRRSIAVEIDSDWITAPGRSLTGTSSLLDHPE